MSTVGGSVPAGGDGADHVKELGEGQAQVSYKPGETSFRATLKAPELLTEAKLTRLVCKGKWAAVGMPIKPLFFYSAS